MALSYFGRNKAPTEGDPYDPVRIDAKRSDEKNPELVDPERQGSARPRRLSRIDKPASFQDTDSGLSIGAQIESEKANAIQYRTCGWKKASFIRTK
jgi:hypothetical protein